MAVWFVWAVTGTLLGRAWWLGGASPAALCVLAASEREDARPLPFLLGVAAGCATRLPAEGMWALLPVLACLTLFCILSLWQTGGRVCPPKAKPFLAGLVWLCCTLMIGRTLLYDRIVAIVGAPLSVALTFIAMQGLRAVKNARHGMTAEEVVCLALLAGLFILGLSDVALGPVMPARVLIIWLTMIVALVGGAAAGGATGALLGAAMALGTGHGGALAPSALQTASLVGVMALGGLTGGALRSLTRVGLAAGYALGMCLCLVLTPGLAAALPFYDLGIAAALFFLTPRALIKALMQSVDAMCAAAREEGHAIGIVRRRTGERLASLARGVSGMGEAIRHGAASKEESEDGARVLCSGAAVCAACSWREQCGEEGIAQLCGDLYEALRTGEGGAPRTSRRCLHMSAMTAAMDAQRKLMAQERAAAQERRESAVCFAGQLDLLRCALVETAADMDEPCLTDHEAARLVRDALCRIGVRCEDVQVLREADAPCVYLRLRPGGCVSDPAREAISQALGRPMACQEGQDGLFMLTPAPKLRCATGYASAPGMAGERSGDSHGVAALPGRFVSVLSDGMGTGSDAKRQSEATVSLLLDLERASLRPGLMLEAVNGILMLRGGEAFSTIDLCVVDACAAKAEVWRLGAAAGAVLRGGKASALPSSSLPAGIVPGARPSAQTLDLQPDDVLVQVSDGICGAEDCDWLCGLLPGMDARNPQALADALYVASQERRLALGLTHTDDATVLVTRVMAAAAESGQTSEGAKERVRTVAATA